MKKLLIILCCGTALIVIAIGAVAWLSWQPQSWYAPPDFSNPEVAKLADRAEYRLNEEFHKIRSVDDTWRLRITDEALNAWLSGRLEGWLTHDQEIEIPEELQGMQVHATPTGLWIAAMVELDDDAPRPVAVQLWITIEDSMARVSPKSIRLGKVPIPISVFKQILEEVQQKTDAIACVVPLMDDREVQIHEIVFEEGALVLTCQTHLPQ
jgi:hypothetical protein